MLENLLHMVRIGDIGLLEHDKVLVLVDGQLRLRETRNLIKNLISNANFAGKLVLDQVHDQVPPNEP